VYYPQNEPFLLKYMFSGYQLNFQATYTPATYGENVVMET
jgi:hypothetical protein